MADVPDKNQLKNEETNQTEPLIRDKHSNMSKGAVKLRTWLNKSLRIQMFDGRILIGVFLCTDRDANVIMGSCTEYLPNNKDLDSQNEEPRMLGLVMVPGRHIQSVAIDKNEVQGSTLLLNSNINGDVN